jgi:uncharacterized protein (TIGR00251 family)
LSYCRREGDDLLLDLWVLPGARHSELVGRHGSALKVRVAAPPVEGRANNALVTFLAELFAVPKSHVRLERGRGGRSKQVRVISPAQLPEDLSPT